MNYRDAVEWLLNNCENEKALLEVFGERNLKGVFDNYPLREIPKIIDDALFKEAE